MPMKWPSVPHPHNYWALGLALNVWTPRQNANCEASSTSNRAYQHQQTHKWSDTCGNSNNSISLSLGHIRYKIATRARTRRSMTSPPKPPFDGLANGLEHIRVTGSHKHNSQLLLSHLHSISHMIMASPSWKEGHYAMWCFLTPFMGK